MKQSYCMKDLKVRIEKNGVCTNFAIQQMLVAEHLQEMKEHKKEEEPVDSTVLLPPVPTKIMSSMRNIFSQQGGSSPTLNRFAKSMRSLSTPSTIPEDDERVFTHAFDRGRSELSSTISEDDVISITHAFDRDRSELSSTIPEDDEISTTHAFDRDRSELPSTIPEDDEISITHAFDRGRSELPSTIAEDDEISITHAFDRDCSELPSTIPVNDEISITHAFDQGRSEFACLGPADTTTVATQRMLVAEHTQALQMLVAEHILQDKKNHKEDEPIDSTVLLPPAPINIMSSMRNIFSQQGNSSPSLNRFAKSIRSLSTPSTIPEDDEISITHAIDRRRSEFACLGPADTTTVTQQRMLIADHIQAQQMLVAERILQDKKKHMEEKETVDSMMQVSPVSVKIMSSMRNIFSQQGGSQPSLIKAPLVRSVSTPPTIADHERVPTRVLHRSGSEFSCLKPGGTTMVTQQMLIAEHIKDKKKA